MLGPTGMRSVRELEKSYPSAGRCPYSLDNIVVAQTSPELTVSECHSPDGGAVQQVKGVIVMPHSEGENLYLKPLPSVTTNCGSLSVAELLSETMVSALRACSRQVFADPPAGWDPLPILEVAAVRESSLEGSRGGRW